MKQDRKCIDTLELWYCRGFLSILETAKKINQWISKQINIELSLEAQTKLSHFGHSMSTQLSGTGPNAGKNERKKREEEDDQ